MVRKSILHSKLTDVHLRSFSWQIEFFLPFLEPMSLALAIFHLHEHNTSGFEVSGMVHCVHWENATIFCWCSRTQAFQKYKVPATFEGFVATSKNLQHNFPKMRGGVKGRLELFRKFIRFGGGRLPLVSNLLQSLRHSALWRKKAIKSFLQSLKKHEDNQRNPDQQQQFLSFGICSWLGGFAFIYCAGSALQIPTFKHGGKI